MRLSSLTVSAVQILTVVLLAGDARASGDVTDATAKLSAARSTAEAATGGRAAIDAQADNLGSLKETVALHASATCPATSITIPRVLQGTLTTSSCLDVLGLREDVYTFTATAGQALTIDMSSTAFDVFPYMSGSTRTTLSYRASSGTSTVRLTYTVPSTGTYKVEAEALWAPPSSQPNTGPYTLSISLGTAPPPTDTYPNHACGFYPILCGTSQSARLTFGSCTLDNGTFADYYTFSGTVGQKVSVTLNTASSTYTRPFVALLPPQGDATTPPYGTGTTSAAIDGFVLTSTGTWAIGVSTLDVLALGNYTVSLSCASACIAPSIGSQPQSTTVRMGEQANLSVLATGTSPFHYSWHPADSPSTTVGGDSPLFQTPPLVHDAAYFVSVSNSCGSISSSTAAIQVKASRRRSVGQ